MKKIKIENHPNSYELIVTEENGAENRYLYFNPVDLAYGIIVHVSDDINTDIELESMRQAIYDHAEHQRIFDKLLQNARRDKIAVAETRDRYKKERDELAKELRELKKQK